MDFSDVTFSGQSAAAPMKGADFSGAKLVRTVFQNIDLTGAVFTGADLTKVRFTAVTCPDGQPEDGIVYGAAECRL